MKADSAASPKAEDVVPLNRSSLSIGTSSTYAMVGSSVGAVMGRDAGWGVGCGVGRDVGRGEGDSAGLSVTRNH